MAPVSTEDDFDPMPYAHAQMASHILQKGFQSGSLVGSVVVGPILAYRAGQRPLVVSTAGRSALVGVFLSACLGVAKLHDQDHEAVAERVYRLHYNVNQHRTDAFSQMGAAAGSGIAAAMTTQGMLPPGIWSVLGGAAVGTAAGLLAHGATAPKKEKGPKKKWLAGVTKDVQDAIEAMQ